MSQVLSAQQESLHLPVHCHTTHRRHRGNGLRDAHVSMSCAPHSGRHVSQRLILTSRARTSSARTRPRLSARGTAAAGRGTVCRSEMRLASSIEIMGQREPRAAPSALSHVCLSAIVHPVPPLVRGEKKVCTATRLVQLDLSWFQLCTRPCVVAALWGLRVKGRAGRVRWTPSNVTRQWGPSLPTGRAPQTMSVPAPASARENLAPRTPPQREGHCAGFSTGSRRQSMIMRKRRAHGLDWRGVGAFRGDTPAQPPAVRVVCVQGGRVVCLSWPACMAHSHRSARVHPQIRDIANNERLVQLSEGYKHQIHELHKYLFCLRGTRARASVFVSPVWGS